MDRYGIGGEIRRRRAGLGWGGVVVLILALGLIDPDLAQDRSAPRVDPGRMLVEATAASPPESPASPGPAAPSKEACLECHGPFPELAQATSDYVAPSGEKGTPHRFVPHERKDPGAIPGCTNCHQPHPLPPATTPARQRASVTWCYGACHHDNNFTPCRICHQ